MIDGRQWSCACSSVQLCAPEMLVYLGNADASTPDRVSDLVVMVLSSSTSSSSSLICVRVPQVARLCRTVQAKVPSTRAWYRAAYSSKEREVEERRARVPQEEGEERPRPKV